MLRRHRAVILLAGLSMMPFSSRTMYGQVSPQAEEVQRSALAEIRTSIVRAIGAQEGTVELAGTRTVFRVLRVNSNMNDSTHAGRDTEAAAIAGIVSEAIAGKPEFSKLVTLRVEYITRSKEGNVKIIDTVEFREDPNGVFRYHNT